MTITSELRDDGIRVVTMEHPPVNALTVQGWFDVAAALAEASADMDTKVVVLRAEGRGFNAGVDIKEMQHTSGFDALIGANKGCYAAFKAVYECSVPVIAAVNGFCVGGGVGLVGNADCIVASDDAYFGVPEVNQGALGAATHMARLVPPHMLRTLYFTARTIKAVDLVQFGSVLETVPREELMDAALRVATDIASKDTRVIRAAKEALNGIDPVDVNKSYRFEQGFTFEALVRAIYRSDLKDLTLVSWGGADVGLLTRAGKVRKLVYAFVSLDSVPLEPNFQKARQEGTIPEVVELDEGMFNTGLQAAAQRLPFLPMRAGLGSDVLVNNPWIKTIESPYDEGFGHETLVAVPALRLDVALVHMNRADQHGNATYLGPDPYFDDLFCMAADRAYVSCEQVVDTAGLSHDTPVQRLLLNRMMVSGVVETPNGAHFTTCTPDYERDERFQRAYAAAAGGSEEDWQAFHDRFLTGDEAAYQAAVAAFQEEQA